MTMRHAGSRGVGRAAAIAAVGIGMVCAGIAVAPAASAAPALVAAEYGNSEITLTYDLDATPSPDTPLTATCTSVLNSSDTQTTEETTSTAQGSVIVGGLTNGVEYSCDIAVLSSVLGPLTATSMTVPDPMEDVQPEIGIREVSLTGTDPFYDGGATITGYQAVCTPPIGSAVTVDSSALPLEVTGLEDGTWYGCTLSAVNAAGVGSADAEVVRVFIPALPGAVTVAIDRQFSGGFALAWEEPSDQFGTVVLDYVTTCESRTSSWQATVIDVDTSAEFRGVPNGETVDCVVRGRNLAGEGPDSNVVAVDVAGAPDAPTVSNPVVNRTSATFAVGEAADNGAAVTSYAVTCRSAGAAPVTQTSATDGAITVSGLSFRTYRCTARATNAQGSSRPSAAVTIVVRPVPPAPRITAVSVGRNSLGVTFTPGTPAVLPATTSYRLTCTQASNTYSVTVGSTARRAGLERLPANVVYSCRVTALNVVGASDPSNARTVKPYGP